MVSTIVSMFEESGVDGVLARLRSAASAAETWPAIRWRRIAGPGPDTAVLAGHSFVEWQLQPGEPVTLAYDLDLPDEIAATPLRDDALDVMLLSCYPTTLSCNGTLLVDDELPSVALGPALVRVRTGLQPGHNGELRMTVHPPKNQMSAWHQLFFSTPRLRARFELLDVAWAQLALASHLAVSAADREAVQRAAALVPDALESLRTEAIAERLAPLNDVLAPLAERMASLRVHVIGHSHIDMNWLWTWPDTRRVITRDVRSVLAMMDDYPDMTFTHSQPATYAVIQAEAPDLFSRLLDRVHEGRWEPATMTWVEGDTNIASGEAMARQLLEAVTYSREQLGVQPTIFFAPDTFGHAGTLPQLAVSAGAVAYYHHRCNPGFTAPEQTMWPAYWWEGQDGSRLLGISTPSYNGFLTAGALAEAAIAAHRQGQLSALFFHGVGDHGGGPARQGLDVLHRLQRLPVFVTAQCSTVGTYVKEVLQSGVALPVHRGESATVFEGCYTTQSEIKRLNRQCENVLCTADTLSALAGLPSAADLGDAWRAVLFHQFHDILDGSAISEAYQLSYDHYRSAASAAARAVDKALSILQSRVPLGHIAVTNPLGWDREDVVTVPDLQGEGSAWLRDEAGRLIPGQFTTRGLCFVASVPAFGTAGYHLESSDQLPEPPVMQAVPTRAPSAIGPQYHGATEPIQEYYRIETPLLRAFLRRDSGVIVSLYDKRVRRELVGYGMRRFNDYFDTARTDLALNVVQILDELPNGMSAWHLDEIHRETSLLRGATTRVVESGPVCLVIESQHTVRSSAVTQLITFYRDLPRIDVETTVDWQEQGTIETGSSDLKVAFTARLDDCEAWFETPFGAVRRPADGQEVPALRWADVGGPAYGLAILNDSRYGYDVLGTRVRLTIVRSAYNPDAVADTGVHTLRYSLMPHAGTWREAGVVRQAAGFNQPLLPRVTTWNATDADRQAAAGGWCPRVSDGSVLIACLKPARHAEGRVIRLYESAGQSGEVVLSGVPAGAKISETNVLEDRMGSIESVGSGIPLAFRPWQVRTLLVEE